MKPLLGSIWQFLQRSTSFSEDLYGSRLNYSSKQWLARKDRADDSLQSPMGDASPKNIAEVHFQQSSNLRSATHFVTKEFKKQRESIFSTRQEMVLTILQHANEYTPEDAEEKRRTFAMEVKFKMDQLNVDRVYAADQTAVFYEYVASQTISDANSKTVWVRSSGKDKDRMSLMLLGDSFGKNMLLLLF